MPKNSSSPATVLHLDEQLRVSGGGDGHGEGGGGAGKRLAELALPVDGAWLEMLASGVQRSGETCTLTVGRDVQAVIEPARPGTGPGAIVVTLGRPAAPRPDIFQSLYHQVVNGLMLTRSVIRLTAETAPSVEACAGLIESRLDALNSVLVRMVQVPDPVFTLGGLLLEVLSEQDLLQHDRTSIRNGPDIAVLPTVAQTLALLFHELAVNAVQHGRLMVDGGTLEVSWTRSDDDAVIRWVERGTQFIPGTPGFGMMVMEEMIPYQLEGRVERSVREGAFSVTIHLPLRRLARER